MSDTAPALAPSKARRKPRAWWQWLIGLLLIGFALYSFLFRWVTNAQPDWFLKLSALEPTPFDPPTGMKESETVPGERGSMSGANVLLVTLDTTRADRVGCYGNRNIKTPFLDGLAKEGVLFSKAYAPGPTTLPSHCSILTGLYPYHHGARANAFTRLPDDQITLAEVLSGQAYATGAFISAFVLDSRFGISQGFGEYDDDVEEKLDPVATSRDPERSAKNTTDRAIEWLRTTGGKPFFAWVHYFDPHQPYTPPAEYAEEYKGFLYDGEIAYTDSQLGRLLEVLTEMKVSDRTLVVVIGDHGQGFLQHLELTHGLFLYDSTLHVPFIMRYGSRWGGVHVGREVSAVDVMPTVLSLMGVSGPAPCDGEDLTRPASSPGRAILGETLEGLDQHAVAPLLAIREKSWKYVHAPEPELYDLSVDPHEEDNIAEDHPDKVQALKDRLSRFYDNDLTKALHIANTEQLTEQELAQLRALGYASLGGGPLVPGAASLPDPKSVVSLIIQCERAWEIKRTDGEDAAVRHMESLLDGAPDFYAGYRLLATFLLDAKQDAKAIQALERCLEIHPDIPFPLLHLARGYLKAGQVEKSIAMYEKALAACPDLYGALSELGELHLRGNQPAIAAKYLKRAVMLCPTDQARIEKMAMAMAQAGEAEEAIALLRSKLQKNPDLLYVRNSLSGLLMDQDKCDEVIPLMREGIKRHPETEAFVHNLAYAIIKCKRADDPMIEAAVMMEQLCEKTHYQKPEYLRTLAMVYAELFRVDEAIGVAEKGLARAEEMKRPSLSRDLKELLAIYREMKRRGISPMTGLKQGLAAPAPTSQPSPPPRP